MESIVNALTIAIFGLCLVFPIFHIGNALLVLRKKPYYLEDKGNISEKSLGILVPCFNEESIMKTTISGIDSLNYKNYEYVLINDGSTDHTFEMMEELLELRIEKIKPDSSLEFAPVKGVYRSKKNPRILVIDKVNGGKADALNAGIAYEIGRAHV